MTELQFNEIKERLSKWREERRLTYENQQAGFLGNVFEEISEYFRAKDNLERVDALCDIVIFCFNSFDLEFKEIVKIYDFDATKISIVDITDDLTYTTAKFMRKDFKNFNNIHRLVFNCKHLCNNLGFDFYKCMLETIKDIESRTGYYDKEKSKFIKNDGAYNKEDLLEKYPISKYSISEDNTHFIIFNKKGHTETFIKKWYKADCESCRL
ncbi:hypothetical protein CJY68_09355 [Campylobacter coli]|nr:hypothetical protein [Campylobacter coli]